MKSEPSSLEHAKDGTVTVPDSAGTERAARRRVVRIGLYFLVLLGLVGWAGFRAVRNAWSKSYHRAARQALDQQNYTQALANLRICLTYFPDDSELHFLTARTVRRAALLGDAPTDWETEAFEQLRECERLNYPPEDIALERTLVRAMHGDLEQVEPHLLSLLTQEHPDSAVILETLVPIYLARFQVPRALLCVSRLLAEEPDNAYAYYWRGILRELLLSHGQAIDDYRRVLERMPDFDDARRRLAEKLLVVHHYEEARQHFEQLLVQTPGDQDLLLGLARAVHGLSDMAMAQTVLDRLLAIGPANGLALEERGKVAFELGQTEEAEKLLRKAVQLKPHQAQANYTLFQCLLQRGQKEEAAKYRAQFEQIETDSKRFEKVSALIRSRPQSVNLRAEAGILLLRHDQTAQGLGWLGSALQVDPYHPAANQALAGYYAQLGQEERADRHRQLAVQGMKRQLENLSIPLL
jgi:tetratricopeptide (TPR) repeat protein